MPRTVEKIMKDDEDKASLGVNEEEIVVGGEQETDETADKGPTPEEQVALMKKERDEAIARADQEAAGRREAEERAESAATSAGTAVQSQIATHEAAIESKISAAKTSLESIKQQLKQAKAAGDGDAEVDLQDALTNARYELNTAEWEKKNFNTWKEGQKTRQPAAETEKKSPYTAKEQAWIAAHPEFDKNPKFSRMAKGAASAALEFHKQDSPGYFKYIEDMLEEYGLLNAQEEPLSGAGDTKTTASTAAAPNRDGSGAPAGPNKNSKYPYVPKGFTIPADWVQAAQDQGFDDPREYANMRLEDEAKSKGNA